MRFKHSNGHTVHLSYVTSAHPAPDVHGICRGLDTFSGPVRDRLDADVLGVTLVIPSPAALELDREPAAMRTLKEALRRNHLEVTGLHGVPVRMYDPKRRYGVFRPDWAEDERLQHTLRLGRIMTQILPDDESSGVISTIPFYWRTRHDRDTHRIAIEALQRLCDGLARHSTQTGRMVRVAMEPEPGCAVETVERAVKWLGPDICTCDAGEMGVDFPWIGLCVDACHMAVQFEDASKVLDDARQAKAPLLKLQLANALRVKDPLASADWLSRFVDPGRLHQTRERRPDGTIYGVDDLSAALPGGLPGDSEWRIHYHLPVYLEENSTQDYLSHVMRDLVNGPQPITHLETETYTWPMLPMELRPPGDDWIVQGLARELGWARDRLIELGLRQI